jgi:hypothetical protein
MSKKPSVYEQIIQKYPRVFTGGNTIELHNVGWVDIIDDVCSIINDELEHMPEELAQGIYASQIKTKFGGLRFYMSHSTPIIEGAIRMAEMISLRACEVCGNKGFPITIGSWTSTFCTKHRHQEEERVAAERIKWAKEELARQVEDSEDPK